MTATRSSWRLDLEVEEALMHMLAVTGCVLLIFLLAILLVKCGFFNKIMDQHNNIEVKE